MGRNWTSFSRTPPPPSQFFHFCSMSDEFGKWLLDAIAPIDVDDMDEVDDINDTHNLESNQYVELVDILCSPNDNKLQKLHNFLHKNKRNVIQQRLRGVIDTLIANTLIPFVNIQQTPQIQQTTSTDFTYIYDTICR
jgi:hypothetical protein